MDIETILAQLRSERDRLDRAIAALSGIRRLETNRGRISRGRARIVKARSPRRASKSGGLTLAGRKRLSEAMKKRWAERKKKGQKTL